MEPKNDPTRRIIQIDEGLVQSQVTQMVPVLQGARGNAYYFACPSLPGTGAHGSVYSLDDCFFTPLRDQSSSLSSKM
jgi:hypothetical protein